MIINGGAKTLQKTLQGNLLIAFSAIAFAIMPILAKYAYSDGANPVNFLATRFFIAALTLTVIMLIKKDTWRLAGKQYIYLIGLGIGGYAMVAGLYFTSITKIPVSLASMLLYLYPAMVMLYTVASGAEKFELRKAIALTFSMGGIALILGFPGRGFDLLGTMMAVGAAFFYSIYIITGKRLMNSISPLVTTTFMSWAATAGFAAFGLITGDLNLNFGSMAWGSIITVALVSTVAAVLAFMSGLRIIGASQASIISTIEPLVTAVLSLLLFQEVLTWLQFTGGGLILLATVLLQLKSRGVNVDGYCENSLRKNHSG